MFVSAACIEEQARDKFSMGIVLFLDCITVFVWIICLKHPFKDLPVFLPFSLAVFAHSHFLLTSCLGVGAHGSRGQPRGT